MIDRLRSPGNVSPVKLKNADMNKDCLKMRLQMTAMTGVLRRGIRMRVKC